MKLSIPLLFCLISLCAPVGMQDMIGALKNGDANALSNYFDKHIDITLDGSIKNYTKVSAREKIANIFQAMKVNDFTVIHKSESNGSQYFIGNLKGAAHNYRLTIYVKTKNNQQLIQQIQFER